VYARRGAIGSLLALAALGGCASGAPPPATVIEPRLGVLQVEVFATSCGLSASCHAGPTPKEGLDLTGSVWSKIVNRPAAQVPEQSLVVPGDPGASYLYEKVSRVLPSRGVRMPNASPPLDPAALTALRTWILEGAKDD
jgi:hypothetical protein